MENKPWTVTRTERGLVSRELSREQFDSLSAAIENLAARGIPVTSEHEAEIASHPDTQFEWREMVSDVASNSAYMASVQYDLRPTENMPEQRAVAVLRCKSCGAVGSAGAYPFSTLPGSGHCDDCV